MNEVSAVRSAPETGKVLNVVLWVLQVALAAVFLMAGGSKLASAPPMVAVFEKIGIGQWFRYLTGALEVIGAVGLLVPRTTAWAAAMLACVMVGAVITHLAIIGGNPAVPIVLLILSVAILWGRRDRIL